jgi:hypothetical protein
VDGEVGPRTGAGGRVVLVHCAGTRRVALGVGNAWSLFLYYMLSSGGFASECLQTIAKGGSSILGRPGQTRAMSRASTTRRPVHTLTTVEGVAVFVPPRTPQSSEYDFYAHTVYVVICYMSIICCMPLICLVQSPPQEAVVVFGYIEGSFLVSKTGCARERHAPCIGGSFLVNRTGHTRERHTP